MGKGQVSNHSKGPKAGLNTGEVRRTSKTELWRCGMGGGGAEVEPGRKCLVTTLPEEGIRLVQVWCADASKIGPIGNKVEEV